MTGSRVARLGLRTATIAGLAFIYVPLIIIVIYAFSESRALAWPIRGLSLRWWEQAFGDPDARAALITSFQAALGATGIALLLGSLASFAVQRYRFFGRETISFVVILPIALPGIVTGMALNSSFRTFGIDLSLFTIIVGHATFCVVIVYNNVIARLRRTARSIEEASMDLGADTWQTFRYVTFPVIRTALLAGGLLAFALSFDEVIVTTFTTGGNQTLPIYILKLLSRDPSPTVNVIAVVVIVLSAIPVYVAQRLSSDAGATAGRA
ncbi:MAG TPA: ABC transporter permease [Candidatus Limnocylindrales bacterium]|nr:ABC transporter permease [Candidatus Limnocylindrales bacterium]